MPFTFRDPFPFSLGPNCTDDYDRLETVYKANLGDALSTEDMTTADAKMRATCLMFLGVKRANRRRITQQQDPRTLTDPLLARYEAILAIQRPANEAIHLRRARVAARLLAHYDATSGSLSTIVTEAFAPWTAVIHYTPIANAVTNWPGGTPPWNDANAWYSTVALICVEYIKPYAGTDAEAKTKREACLASLDEVCPAWVRFGFHETPPGYDFHWYSDISRTDITAVGDP